VEDSIIQDNMQMNAAAVEINEEMVPEFNEDRQNN
jgi:hypothetical protein